MISLLLWPHERHSPSSMPSWLWILFVPSYTRFALWISPFVSSSFCRCILLPLFFSFLFCFWVEITHSLNKTCPLRDNGLRPRPRDLSLENCGEESGSGFSKPAVFQKRQTMHAWQQTQAPPTKCGGHKSERNKDLSSVTVVTVRDQLRYPTLCFLALCAAALSLDSVFAAFNPALFLNHPPSLS